MPLIDSCYSAVGRVVPAWPPLCGSDLRPADLLIHGASAGEVKAARACLPALAARWPGSTILVTTGTEAGIHAGAEARLPRDFDRAIERMLDAVRPRAVVLVEGEIWPNLLRCCLSRGIPVAVIGARLTPRSLRRFRWVPATARVWFRRVVAFAAASPRDAERLILAGADPDRVRSCGWLKWPEGADNRGPALSEGPLVFGSAWPGEIRALHALLGGGLLTPSARPWRVFARHAAHGERLIKEARGVGGGAGIEVEATFGGLRAAWARAGVAVVGGGLAGRGVHDLLEPLSFGLRPLFWSRRGDAADVGETLVDAGLAVDLDRGPADPPWTVPPRTLQDLRGTHDGRQRAVDFLAAHLGSARSDW